MGSEEPYKFKINPFPEVLFVHRITLNGPKGSVVHVRGVFDSGAMVNTLCSSVYNKIKHQLSKLQPSKRHFEWQMVPSYHL